VRRSRGRDGEGRADGRPVTRLRPNVGPAAQELDAFLYPEQAEAFTPGGAAARGLHIEADAVVADGQIDVVVALP
jgi:hypothetical protein